MKTIFSRLNLIVVTGLLAAFAGSEILAAPMVSVGNNVDIFFNGRASLVADDNIALDETNELDDFIFHFVPGIEVKFGRGETNADFTVLWQEDFVRYSSEDQFDAEQTSLFAIGNYKSPKFAGSARVAFLERQSNSNSINFPGALIDQDIFTGSGIGEWELTPKTSFSGGLRFNNISYQGLAASVIPDRDNVSIPLDLYYEVTPKLDFSAGYRFRDVDIEDLNGNIGNDPEDHRFTLGLRGEFNPKLTGEVKVGFQERSFSVVGLSDESGLSAEGELVWQASPKTQFTTSVDSDFAVGGGGGTIERRGLDFDWKYGLSQLWFFGARAGFRNSDYTATNREDDLINFGLSLTYNPNEYVKVKAGYQYTDNDSNLANASYSRNLLNITASLRY